MPSIYSRLAESLLLVEDIDAVRRQYSHIPAEDFDKIIRLDPTFDENRDSVGKYGKWLLGLYKKDNPLNIPNVKGIVNRYNELKNDRAKDIEKDVNKFKSIEDMVKACDEAGEVELTKRQKQRGSKSGYELVSDDGEWAVFKILTPEGAVKLGKGSGWCTAYEGSDYYDYYLREGGSYYVIMNEKDKNDKYQVHFESKQLVKGGNGDKPTNVEDPEDWFDEHPSVKEYFESIGYDCDNFNGNGGVVTRVASTFWQGDLVYRTLDPSSWLWANLEDTDEDWVLIKVYWLLFNDKFWWTDLSDFEYQVWLNTNAQEVEELVWGHYLDGDEWPQKKYKVVADYIKELVKKWVKNNDTFAQLMYSDNTYTIVDEGDFTVELDGNNIVAYMNDEDIFETALEGWLDERGLLDDIVGMGRNEQIEYIRSHMEEKLDDNLFGKWGAQLPFKEDLTLDDKVWLYFSGILDANVDVSWLNSGTVLRNLCFDPEELKKRLENTV